MRGAYASLQSLRASIFDRKVISFQYRKELVVVQPLEIDYHSSRGSLVLFCWVMRTESGEEQGFARFNYSMIRSLEVRPETFSNVYLPDDHRKRVPAYGGKCWRGSPNEA